MWGNGGHAIVAYGTNVAGNDRQLYCYDNNVPYAENENRPDHPSIAHVYWSGNTFSYGGYNKAVAMTYDECVTTPHLPASAAGSSLGGVAGQTVVAVLSPGARVAQITDEVGRRFFNADGSENRDQATRIPNCSRFIPMTGNPPTPNDPLIFVFGTAQNRSLNFDLQGNAPKTLSLFQPGTVMQAEVGGAGQIRFNNALTPQRSLELPNPAQLQPTRLQIIQALQAGDRSFELLNLRNVGPQGLRLTPATDGANLEVQSGAVVQFDVRVGGPQGPGAALAAFSGLATQAASRALLQPANWQNLGQGALNLQLRGLQDNQLLNQRAIQPR